MVIATVRVWHDEDGWGVLDSAETPGGCFAHYSDVEPGSEGHGYRALEPGQRVELTWEQPGFEQDGFDYRATRVVPLRLEGWASVRRQV